MTRKTKAPPKNYVLDTIRPGVFQVRRKDIHEGGTVKADRYREAVCTVCITNIGDEPFVLVNDEPKHEKHLRGE